MISPEQTKKEKLAYELADKHENIIKFLLNDNAFSRDFIITAIFEYIANHIESN